MTESHPFDAIVQAANPAHPDHSAWVERFGTSSRTHRSSNAGSSTHRADNFSNLRKEAEQRGNGVDAEAVAQDEEGNRRSPGGSRRPSVSAGSGTPKRKKRKDKGKGRAPARRVPPPRTTSVLGAAAQVSPPPPPVPAPHPSTAGARFEQQPPLAPAETSSRDAALNSEIAASLARTAATTASSESQSTSSKHRKKKKAPRLPAEPPELAPRRSSFAAEREPHEAAYVSSRGWKDMPPLPPHALGNVQAYPREGDRSPVASAGHSRVSFDIPSGSARPLSPGSKGASSTDREAGSSVRRSLDSVFAPFGMGSMARKAREEEEAARQQVIERMSAASTAAARGPDGRPPSILTNGSSSRQSLDSAGPSSSMRGVIVGASVSDCSMHGHAHGSPATSVAAGPSASPTASPSTRPPRRMGGMQLMPVGPSLSTGGRPLSSVHDVRESGTEGEENFVDARSEEEGGLGSDDEQARRRKNSLAKAAQAVRRRSSTLESAAERRKSLENGHAAARAARQAALERELPPPNGVTGAVFPLLKHDSDSSAEDEAVDLKGTPIGGAGTSFGSPAAGSLRKRSGSRVSARESLRSQHASPSLDSLHQPPRAATSMGSYEVRRKTSSGLKSTTSSSNLSVTAGMPGASNGGGGDERRERFQRNQYYIPPSFSQPSMPARSVPRSGSTAMAMAQSEGHLAQAAPALDHHGRSVSQPGFGGGFASQQGTPSMLAQQRFPSRHDVYERQTPSMANSDPRPAPPSKSPSSRSIASFFSRSKPVPPTSPTAPPPVSSLQLAPAPPGGEPMAPLASGSTGSTLLTTSDIHFPSASTSPQHTLVDPADGYATPGQAKKEVSGLPARAAIGLGIGATAASPSMENLDAVLGGGRQESSPVVKPMKVTGSGGWRQRVASFSKNSPKAQQLAAQQQQPVSSQPMPELPSDAHWRRNVLTEAVGLSLANGRRGNEQPQQPPSPAMDRSTPSIEGSGGTSSTRPSLDLQRLLGRGGRNKERQSGSAGDSLGVASGQTIHKSLSPAMLDSWTHEADDIDSVIGSIGEEMEELEMVGPEHGPALVRGTNGDFSDSDHGRISTDATTTFDTRTDGRSTPERSTLPAGQRSVNSSLDHDLPDPPIKVRLMRPSVEMSGNSSDAAQTLIGHQRASSVGARGPAMVAAAPVTTSSFAEKMRGKNFAPPAALSLDSSTSAVASLKAATGSTSDLHEQRGWMQRVDSNSLTRLDEEAPRSAGLASNRGGITAALGSWRPKQRSDSTSTRGSAFASMNSGGPGAGFVGGSPMMSPSLSATGSDGGLSSSGLRSPGFLSALRRAAGGGKRKGGVPGTPGSASGSGFFPSSATGGISSADFAFEEQEFMAGDEGGVQPLGNGFTGGPAFSGGGAGNDSLEAARAATDMLAVQSETMPLTPSSYGGYGSGGYGSSAPATPALGISRPRLGSSSANQRPTAWYQPAEGSSGGGGGSSVGGAYVMNGSEPWPGSAGGGAVSSSDSLPSMPGFRPRTMSSSQTGASTSGIGALGGSKAGASSVSLTASVSAPVAGAPASPSTSVRSPDLTMFGQMLARAQAEDAARIKGIAARAVAGGNAPPASPSPQQTRQGVVAAAR